MMSTAIFAAVVFSFAVSLLTGSLGEMTGAILASGGEALEVALRLCGTMAVWGGIMRLAEQTGVCRALGRLLSPVTRTLFAGLRGQSPAAADAITMNITANLLGLGSAATPFGIAAMRELDRINPEPYDASDYMVRFCVLNTASFQLIPSTVASLRAAAGCAQPLDILPCVLVSSAVSVSLALSASALFGRRKRA